LSGLINTASDSRTTAAVNATANYVMIKPGATRIGLQDHGVFGGKQFARFLVRRWLHAADGRLPCGSGLHRRNRFGHGRGMCQWGTARWASGRRMQNRVTGDSVTNGLPLQNWVWLCEHYYPEPETRPRFAAEHE
jgi:hypothetical protein